MCYTCCVLCATSKSDALEDFSTIKPTKRLLTGRVRPKGRGECTSPQPSLPQTWKQSGVVHFLFPFLWCFQSHHGLGEAVGLVHSSVKALAELWWESRNQAGRMGLPPYPIHFWSWHHPGPQTCSAPPGSPQGPLGSLP